MPGHFTPDTAWKRGRPEIEVPEDLITILDATYTDKKDYVVPCEEDDHEAGELIRYGRLHARHKGLSFRYYFSENGNGESQLRFRMTDKRTYTKKNPQYWDGK